MEKRLKIEQNIELARGALQDGQLRRALRHAWEAGLPATASNDARSLREVIDLGGRIQAHATGRRADEAARLVAYCSHALENPQPPRPGWARFRLGGADTGLEATKDCPDCAETVKAAATVCRFCGHRFEP